MTVVTFLFNVFCLGRHHPDKKRLLVFQMISSAGSMLMVLFLSPVQTSSFTLYALCVNVLIIEGHVFSQFGLTRLQATCWMACVLALLSSKAAYQFDEQLLVKLASGAVCIVLPLAIVLIFTYTQTRRENYSEMPSDNKSLGSIPNQSSESIKQAQETKLRYEDVFAAYETSSLGFMITKSWLQP